MSPLCGVYNIVGGIGNNTLALLNYKESRHTFSANVAELYV